MASLHISTSEAHSLETAKSNGAEHNPLISVYEQSDPNDSITQQALERLYSVAVQWLSVFESMSEQDSYGAEGVKGSLPDWARERMGTWKQQHEAYEEARHQFDLAKQALALAEGKNVRSYEIWTKSGHRLDGRYAFQKEAEAAKVKIVNRHPDAFICRVHPAAPIGYANDPALLDTLIGWIWWAGTSYGHGAKPDEHTLQDSTGRTVTVSEDVLMKSPILDRMTPAARKRVLWESNRKSQDRHTCQTAGEDNAA